MKSKRKHIAIVYEGEKTEKLLQEYSAKDFSEVYLFFDYDPQNNNLPQIYREIDIPS